MPCTCDGYPDPEPDTHNGPLAEMLCESLAAHEARGEMSCFSRATLDWWAEHKKRDAARVAQDLAEARTAEARAAAVAKLTPFERSLLGVEE